MAGILEVLLIIISISLVLLVVEFTIRVQNMRKEMLQLQRLLEDCEIYRQRQQAELNEYP